MVLEAVEREERDGFMIMLRVSIIICIVMFCFSLIGCQSIMCRTCPDPLCTPKPYGIYPAVKWDISSIKEEFRYSFWTGLIMSPIMAIDLVCSSILDTLFIPFDIPRSHHEQMKDEKKSNDELKGDVESEQRE